jgi:hypothetical protein
MRPHLEKNPSKKGLAQGVGPEFKPQYHKKKKKKRNKKKIPRCSFILKRYSKSDGFRQPKGKPAGKCFLRWEKDLEPFKWTK